ERDAGVSDELFDGSGDLGDEVVDVELDDLRAGPRSGVAHGDGGGELAVGGHLGGAEPQVRHLEGGVGGAVTEGEQRGRVEVADAVAVGAERRLQVGGGLAAGRARDLHGQLAGGLDAA